MTVLEGIGFSVLDIIEYLVIITKVLVDLFHFKVNKKVIITIVITAAFVGIVSDRLGSNLSFVFVLMAMIVLTKIIYARSIIDSAYLYGIGAIVIILLQLIILAGAELFFGGMEYNSKTGLIVHGVTLIFVFLIYRFAPLNVLMNEMLSSKKSFKVLIANIYLVLAGALMFWYFSNELFLINVLTISVILLFILVVNVLLFTNEYRRDTERKQLLTYELYLPVISDLMVGIRQKQHEYDNHIQVMNAYLLNHDEEDEEAKKMKNYVQDISFDKRMSQLSKLNNSLIAGFLYSKFLEAEKQELILDYQIDNYLLATELKDYEIIEIIGILIDNAIEASQKGDKVTVHIRKEENKNVIEVINPSSYKTSQEIESMFYRGTTSKSDTGHGYGLYNLANIVKRNKGKYIVVNQDIDNQNHIVMKVLVS